jgi:predicted metal-dependent phosphoesterase TrpH
LSAARKAPGAADALCRADLHVHTRYSGGGHLRARRLRRGLPDPEELVRAARARGLHLVTFTDLDTIDGCLAFLDRHPDAPDFFISEEVRAIEPRTGTRVGVLVYDLTESQHREIQSLKRDVRDVAAYARSTGLLASLGSVLGLLEAGGPEGLVRDLLHEFDRFEIRNGAEDRACNELMARLVQERAAGFGLGVTAGSNAHTVERVGRTATVARAHDRGGFLEALREHRTWAMGLHGGVWSSFAEVLGSVPLHRAAAPLLGHAVARARRNVRARRTKRWLDQIDVRKFQEKARTFGASDREANPGPDEARRIAARDGGIQGGRAGMDGQRTRVCREERT